MLYNGHGQGMKNRLFWKIGFLNLLLLLLVLAAVDTYVVRALKKEFLSAAFSQLESLIRLAETNPPQSFDVASTKRMDPMVRSKRGSRDAGCRQWKSAGGFRRGSCRDGKPSGAA